jgi:hypothetical protein
MGAAPGRRLGIDENEEAAELGGEADGEDEADNKADDGADDEADNKERMVKAKRAARCGRSSRKLRT